MEDSRSKELQREFYLDCGFATRALHAGEHVGQPQHASHTGAIYQTSTFVFKDAAEGAATFAGERPGYVYTRRGNPTVMVLEAKMNALEGREVKLRNPDLRVCKAVNPAMKVVVDNTFATPYLQRPLELGADVVVHSTTKYLCGHGTVVGGVMTTCSDEVKDRAYAVIKDIGGSPSPFDAWLVNLGLKTLPLRMDRHCESAMAVARHLEKHPKVARVYFPGLESSPYHALAKRQMLKFGGMVCFDLVGGQAGGGTQAHGPGAHLHPGRPEDWTRIGRLVTLGHGAMVHNATIRDGAVIGMRAVVSDFSEVGEGTIVGEMGLCKNGQKVPAGKVAVGVPVRVIGDVDERHRDMTVWAKDLYVDLAARYAAGALVELRSPVRAALRK